MTIGKLVKVDREYTVTICDNGYTLVISGRDREDNWANARIVCIEMDELIDLMKQINNTQLND